MNRTAPVIEEPNDGHYPIRAVSQLTGINPITLRAWENRYGLIKPIRKDSGHRLYTQAHIDLINHVTSLLGRGMRIGQVKDHLERQASRIAADASASVEVQNHWRGLIAQMLAATKAYDEEALERVYNEALAHYPVRTVTRNLITPLLEQLGQRWALGEGTISEEHFFGFYLRNKLGARFHHRSRNQQGPKLLMACLPGERHEMGLLMLALAANEAGYCPISLGADLPLQDLAEAAETTQCDAVVLSGMIEPSSSMIKRQLPALVARLQVPIFIGGRASAKALDEIQRLGIFALGADVESGLQRLQDQLPVQTMTAQTPSGNKQ
jgi:DNA-binding transcriptional MerR regulator/methylmalonyl-CoA mutase cobalamin-binding subunit